MTDINTAIAKFKGFRVKTDKRGNGVTSEIYFEDSFCGYVWGVKTIDEIIKENPEIVPDFDHDAQLYMALFGEMVSENKDCHCEIFWNPGRNNFVCWIIEDLEEGGPRDFDAESTDKGTAVCLCFCKLKGIEVVG